MNTHKNDIQISVQGKNIEIKGKTFVWQFNFDNLSYLYMDDEQKAFAEEMEMELAMVEKYHPELKDQLRIALHTPEISSVLTIDRREGDKIASLHYQRFKEAILHGKPLNFFAEHQKLGEELMNENGADEISYPVHFHSCGHLFEDQDLPSSSEVSANEISL